MITRHIESRKAATIVCPQCMGRGQEDELDPSVDMGARAETVFRARKPIPLVRITCRLCGGDRVVSRVETVTYERMGTT